LAGINYPALRARTKPLREVRSKETKSGRARTVAVLPDMQEDAAAKVDAAIRAAVDRS
jgi:hypothetical protein